MENDKPKLGTYGALTRSTEPWPWRRFLSIATFSPQEFAEQGPSVVMRKGQALLDAVREWDGEQMAKKYGKK